jgi:hypothetical protein
MCLLLSSGGRIIRFRPKGDLAMSRIRSAVEEVVTLAPGAVAVVRLVYVYLRLSDEAAEEFARRHGEGERGS